jgi:hypothetical protein
MRSISVFFHELFMVLAIASFAMLVAFAINYGLHLYFCIGAGLTC